MFAMIVALTLVPPLARADVPPEEPEEVGTPFSNDRFGVKIACDGETLAISAGSSNLDAFNGGAVYVYERTGAVVAPWVLKTVLGAPEPRSHAGFGAEIAVEGELLLVTESLQRTASDGHSSTFADENKVHVFLKRDGDWRLSGEIVPEDPAYLDGFGDRLLIHEDTVLIAAGPTPRDGAEDAAVFEFSREGASFVQEAILVPELENPWEQVLGRQIAFDGETLMIPSLWGLHTYRRANAGWERTTWLDVQAVAVDVVGAHAVIEGSGVHVLDRQGDGSWIVAEEIEIDEEVGWIRSLEIEGNTLFIGGGNSLPIYTRESESSAWELSGELVPDATSKYLGWPIVAVDDEVFVGAFEDDRNGYGAGAVLRFSGEGDTWQQTQVFVSEEAPEGCGCRSSGSGGSSLGAWALVLLPMFGVFRRRRDQ